ncbi:universal stress protein UspA [Pueribacillus theae]|uniref:Universal stress protein n=2 Tax=Pueribacillus theae TaxID=2171751 RepID=A0A2U1K148_9BACI|nr:universal stress protein [Pueribacillus theae]PWA11132.1 universal stress protein UspA [Pueribacillus theae]
MMAIYRNVMVAVDGSKEADGAFSRALKIAAADGAKLHIAHVVDTRSLTPMDQYAPYNISITDAESYGGKLLDEYVEKAKMQGYENVEAVLQSGSPKRDLPITLADKYNTDLIVCGATGLNAVERFLIGSVSEQIVRNAHCDVLVVRDKEISRES